MGISGWLRALVGGALWAAAYNAIWGIAWFTFIRQEWATASASVGQALPWTPQFWAAWIPATALIGAAIAAYLASRPKGVAFWKAALAASLALWVPGTIGMAAWAWHDSISGRTIALDSAVNLVAVVAATFLVARGVRAKS